MAIKKPTAEERYILTQQQLEKELVSLRKEWSILDRARGALSGSFMKYAKVSDLFKKEHQNLLNDLSRATDVGRKREDAKTFDILGDEMALYDLLDEYVNTYKVYQKEVVGEIKRVKKSVQQLAKQQVTDRQYQDRIWHAMKTEEALENRLETQMIKFGTICTKNRLLREEIDHHLWDRRNFLTIWNKFIERLSNGKQIMLDLIEQATIAYNQREEWCTKLQALRMRAHHDLVANMDTMRDYIRRQNENLKLEEFFMIKGQKRQMLDLQAKIRQRRLEHQEQLREKLKEYTEMVEDIQRFARETKIEDIAKKFLMQDEFNLSNFNYVIETVREMEVLGDKLGLHHLEIEEKNVLLATRKDQQYLTVQALEGKLEDAKADTLAAEEDIKETDKYMRNLLDGVWKLFKICKCNQDPLLQLLGHNQTVEHYNVDFYMDILEAAVHKLLVTTHYKDHQMSEKKKTQVYKPMMKFPSGPPKIYTIDNLVNTSPCSLCVEHEMVTDVIDSLQIPVTKSQAHKRLARRLTCPGGLARLHNISDCQLPQSRKIMQKRYQ